MHLPLKQLDYLVLDCQSTGNNPNTDHLLEIGWCVFNPTRNTKSEDYQTVLIRPPVGVDLSRRIQRLTGIEARELTQGVDVNDALDALRQCARDVALNNTTSDCPTVIHYARFEMGFLRQALMQSDPSGRLPLDVICTHQVATRLMPHLPRKGLRAVAGYLGHSVPTVKRCKGHLAATQWIWRHMVTQLADEAGVETLKQLHHWLKTRVKPNTPKRYPMPESIRKTVPADPGIYHMKRDNGDVLYIGKAANLKQRVSSYFHQGRRHPEHVLEMLTQAKDLEITPTATALEAALFETDAIKQHNPPYNIALVRTHRDLFYVSRQFERHAPERQRDCHLGPVPTAEPFAAAHALGRQLRAPGREVKIDTLLAMPPAYCPDEATLATGLSVFKKRHGHVFEQKPIGHAVIHIGHRSWLQKMEEKNAVDAADPEDATQEKETAEFSWTPEAVSNALESICRRCGFLLRRARWFHMLGHSQVVWHMRMDETKQCHVLNMNNGIVVKRWPIQIRQRLSNPPAYGGARKAFDPSMDLDTYDRLRVLTTEIRRLVTKERMKHIRLGDRIHLRSDQLRRLLLWI